MVTNVNNKFKKIEFDSDIYNTIRKNVRYYRKEKGMTSAELAELTELSMILSDNFKVIEKNI